VDCGDFPSQAAAQNYFLDHGGPGSDPNGLDAEGDGVACESLPCPCNNSTNNGGGNPGPGPGPAPGPKPAHKISVRGDEIRNTDKFVAVGRIVTFKNGRFQIQRKAAGSGYRPWKFVRTKPTGTFRTKIKQAGTKKTCFKVVVPETERNRRTEKAFGCITG
jgi:hypothetical protein